MELMGKRVSQCGNYHLIPVVSFITINYFHLIRCISNDYYDYYQLLIHAHCCVCVSFFLPHHTQLGIAVIDVDKREEKRKIS